MARLPAGAAALPVHRGHGFVLVLVFGLFLVLGAVSGVPEPCELALLGLIFLLVLALGLSLLLLLHFFLPFLGRGFLRDDELGSLYLPLNLHFLLQLNP